MKRIRPEVDPRLSFQSMPPCDAGLVLRRWFDCAALSESKTVFLDHQSGGGFIYDDDARCVVTLPFLHARKWYPICLAAAAGKEDDNIFVVERRMYPARAAAAGDKDDDRRRFPFQAMVHRRESAHGDLSNVNGWRWEELPPPPYVSDAGYTATTIDSYGMIGGLVCVSTERIGTYCFDTATRTWAKAGDWALPFSGKVEHVPELGVLVGFETWPTWDGNEAEASQRVCAASPLPWTVVTPSSAVVDDGRRRRSPEVCGASVILDPPYEWRRVEGEVGNHPRLVSLGGGKLCAVQFFERKKNICSMCRHVDVDRRFAVFTGLEVVRAGEDEGNGKREIRVVRHKSKRYMLPKDNDNVFIKEVL
ncbi:unnamed protein product [Urochloa humidicola]